MDNELNGEFFLNTDGPHEKKLSEDKIIPIPKKAQKVKVFPHFYSSFTHFPDGVSFEEQEENEDIILLIRRHFATNIPWIFVSFLLILLPLTFPFSISFFPFPLPSMQAISLYIAFYYLVVFGFILINFTLWYFNVGLVTNLHVIDIDLSGILYRQISQAKMEKIEDVTYKQSGFIRSLFNYGDVHVQTAGEEENIEYDRVPRPAKVAEIINDITEEQ
jgi:membrane protein YdbS with pleckstrin-like domain